jgi:hypothetical protein
VSTRIDYEAFRAKRNVAPTATADTHEPLKIEARSETTMAAAVTPDRRLGSDKTEVQYQAATAVVRQIELQIRHPRLGGNGATFVETGMRFLIERSLAIGGPRAFECPKSSAAFHEAGHCVIGALDGVVPSSANIWPVLELGRLQWIGKTYGLPQLRVDEKTDAEVDLRHARSSLAGVVAEIVFDPEYRLGSSLDELATATVVIRAAAMKLGRNPMQLFFETVAGTELALKGQVAIVREIATQLISKGSIKARRLQFLLQPIKGTGDQPPHPRGT